MSNKSGQRDKRPGMLSAAALWATESRCTLVILTRDREDVPWGIAESKTLNATDLSTLASLLGRHGVHRLVRMAPTRDCIARIIDIPLGDLPQMANAAALMSEVELPSTIPPHRRAGALIGEPQRVGIHAALLTAWVERGTCPSPVAGITETWTTPAAALAMLRGDASRVAMFADSSCGAAVALAAGHERSVARVMLEDAADEGTWTQRAVQELHDTSARVGAEVSQLRRYGNLWLDPESVGKLRTRVKLPADCDAWIAEFGLVLGAVLVSVDRSASPLASLLRSAPVIDQPLLIRGARAISKPRTAVWVGVAAGVVMLFAPLGLGWARNQLLSGRTSVLEATKDQRAEIDKKAALYGQLEISRRPMSKLLADLCGATPVGVVATEVRLDPEQGLNFQGTADTPDLVSSFQDNLTRTRIFSNVKVARVESSAAGGVEFSLSADIPVKQAHSAAKPAEDFSAKSLAVRLYGDGADGATGAPTKDDGKSSRGPRRSSRPEGARSEDRQDAPKTPSDAPPPAVTDADIAKMDLATANRGWIARKVYVQKNPGLDAATQQRLKEEEEKIRARADALKNAGGGK